MIHSGSVIAAGISQGRSTSLKRDFKVGAEVRGVVLQVPFCAIPGCSPWWLGIVRIIPCVSPKLMPMASPKAAFTPVSDLRVLPQRHRKEGLCVCWSCRRRLGCIRCPRGCVFWLSGTEQCLDMDFLRGLLPLAWRQLLGSA